MSFSALWAEATHWDFQHIGHGVRPHSSGESSHPAVYDVKDKKCEEPLGVLDTVVRPLFFGDGPRIWRLTSFGLPPGCESPLCIPASLDVFKEVRSPAHVVMDGKTSTLRETPAALQALLEHLPISEPEAPNSRFTLCWQEPLIRAELTADQSTSSALEKSSSQKYIQSIIMGPKISATVARLSTGKLELLELHGGPDGIDEIAPELFRTALGDIEAAKIALEAEIAAKNAPKDKPIFVFGKLWRPPEKRKGGRTKIVWDAESESFALWSALQQWERSVRRQPWRWQLHKVEIGKGSLGSTESIVALPDPASTSRKSKFHRSATTSFRPTTQGSSSGRPKTGMDSNLRENELLALMRGFDKDSSGSIDWKEFRDCSKSLVDLIGGPDANWTEEVARREFEELDANGNGMIEEEEWLMFVGSVLSVLGDSGMQRVLSLLGQDMSAFSTRTLSLVDGDVDIGMACKKGHAIRPLRLNPWGDQLAKQLGLDGGFLCAAVDDPPVFNASSRQRCTYCNTLNAQATFAVTCKPCGESFPSGWWCTSCVMEMSVPRDRHGRRVPLTHVSDLKATCRFCSQAAIIVWPLNVDSFQLCHNHAADRLLEEAARGSATSGRELEDGSSLLLVLGFKVKVPLEEDEEDLERFAELLEGELLQALSLDGAPPDESQLEVSKLLPVDGSKDCCSVQVTVTRSFGRPSPYELFLRFRSLGVDLDGPLYDSKFSTLSRMTDVAEIVDIVVADEDEEVDMAARVAEVVEGQWPHAISASKTALVARPQRSLLPRSAVLSLRCARGPEGVGGGILAYALAFVEGARSDVPSFHEFESFVHRDKGNASIAASAKSKAAAKGTARKPKARSGRRRGTIGASAEPVSGCIVCLSPSPGGGHEMLIGEATIFGLKPGFAYDVYAAIFPTVEGSHDDLEPLAWVSQSIQTCPEENARLFGEECDGIVHLMTEEPHVKRSVCFLDMLGLRDAPCIIDQTSCNISSKPAGRNEEVSKDILREHHIRVKLEDAEIDAVDSPAIAGGLQLPTPVLLARPHYTQTDVSLEATVSADVVDLPCARHRFSGGLELPLVLSSGGSVTNARCCKPTSENVRCPDCRWTQVKQMHRIHVKVSIDIVRMAQIQDWVSVKKRAEVCQSEDVKRAVALMINARPQIETDVIMTAFELATGRSPEVDFPVRPDGATALHAAVEENHMDVARALLDRKADPCVVNSSFESPLHFAARGGSGLAPQLVDMLLGEARAVWKGEDRHAKDMEGAKQKLLDLQDINGHTALHLASSAGQVPLVRCLLRSRADPHVTDSVGWNALHMAAASGATTCAAALIADRRLDVNALTDGERKTTPLHLACERCNVDAIVELMNRSADPRLIGNENKHVLVSLSEGISQWSSFLGMSGVVEVVQQILRKSQPPKFALEEAGCTLCKWALRSSNNVDAVAVAQNLLDCLRSYSFEKKPALGSALLDVIASAVGSGAQGRAGDRYEPRRLAYAQTPTVSAMHLTSSVQLALQLGADINALDKESDSLLHHLLRYVTRWRLLPNDGVAGQVVASSVHLLLDNQANINLSNKHGEKPLALVQRMDDMGKKFAMAWNTIFGNLAVTASGSLSPNVSSGSLLPTVSSGSLGRASVAVPQAPPGRPNSRSARKTIVQRRANDERRGHDERRANDEKRALDESRANDVKRAREERRANNLKRVDDEVNAALDASRALVDKRTDERREERRALTERKANDERRAHDEKRTAQDERRAQRAQDEKRDGVKLPSLTPRRH